jgi:ActR/RegA family two-component response regulator
MTAPNGLMLSDDLIFASRVTATARAHGLSVEQVRDPDELLSRAAAAPPDCVVVDLQVAAEELQRIVGRLVTLLPRPCIVAFGSHVAVESLHAAREAGCDVVLTRSEFADRLERDLPQWLRCPS